MLDKYRELCNAYDIDGMIPTDVAVGIIDDIEKGCGLWPNRFLGL